MYIESMKINNRRKFLKNVTLGSVAIGLTPLITKGESKEQSITPLPPVSCNPTTLDYYGEGPFYTANPPTIPSDNQLAPANEPGTRLIISGVVRTLDCSQVIPNAEIDIWHADASGAYDNTGGYHLRGKTTSNSQGVYIFETIQPGKYLNGNQYRPSHIHIKVTAPGFSTLTTQIYFTGDTDIPNAAAASVSSGTYDATHRIIDLTTNIDGKLEGNWDIVVNGNGITDTESLHLENGMIYKADPNPFTDKLEIQYGVFKESKVNISVSNIEGKIIANLIEENHHAEKYTAEWQPEDNLPKGYYFVMLKVNDLQVHHLKVLKE